MQQTNKMHHSFNTCDSHVVDKASHTHLVPYSLGTWKKDPSPLAVRWDLQVEYRCGFQSLDSFLCLLDLFFLLVSLYSPGCLWTCDPPALATWIRDRRLNGLNCVCFYCCFCYQNTQYSWVTMIESVPANTGWSPRGGKNKVCHF